MSKSADKILRDRDQRSQLVLFRLTKEREVTRSSLLLELFQTLDLVRHIVTRFNHDDNQLSPDAAIELKFRFSNHLVSRWKNIFANFTPKVEIDEEDLIQSANYRASSFVYLLEEILSKEGEMEILNDVDSLRVLRPLAFASKGGQPQRFSQENHLSREIMMVSDKLLDIVSTALREVYNSDPNSKSMFSLSVEVDPVLESQRDEYFNSFDFKFITFDPQFSNWLRRCRVSKRNFIVEHDHGKSKAGYTTTDNLIIRKQGTHLICGSNHKPTRFSAKRGCVENEGQKPFTEIVRRGNFNAKEDNSFCLDHQMFKDSHSIGESVDYEELGHAKILIKRTCRLMFLEVEEQCNIHSLPACDYTDYMYDTPYVRALTSISLVERTLRRIRPFMDEQLLESLSLKVDKLREFASREAPQQ